MQIYRAFIVLLCIVALVDRTGVGQETKEPTTQSKPAQIKISIQDGILKLDDQENVFTDLHVFDGNNTGPARPQVITRVIELEKGSVKHPLPIGAVISRGISGRSWAIYANTVLDFQISEEDL
jgi:hypothetical protein